MTSLTYSFREYPAAQVLQVSSLYNEFDNRELLRDVEKHFRSGKNNLVVDLSKVTVLNSVGLNFLLRVRNRTLENGGNLMVVNAPRKVVELLEMMKLKPFFKLLPSIDKALASLRQVAIA